jgi:fermentation-respiration switch protein FrsA (DUF1100 family)
MRESTPYAEPGPFLERVPVPVRLVHGRRDRLFPFSETLRIHQGFPETADVRTHLTGLFGHSYPHGPRRWLREVGERITFLRVLTDILGLV